MPWVEKQAKLKFNLPWLICNQAQVRQAQAQKRFVKPNSSGIWRAWLELKLNLSLVKLSMFTSLHTTDFLGPKMKY